MFGVLPASVSFSTGAATLNTSYLLIAGENQSQFTMVEKSPAFVFGEYVIAPMIAKVSACFSRICSTFKSFDGIFQFPMAEGAKVSSSVNAKAKTFVGLQQKLREVMEKREQLKAEIEPLDSWLTEKLNYVSVRTKEMEEQNSKTQRHKRNLTAEQLEAAANQDVAFQTEMNTLIPQIQAYIDELNQKNEEISTLEASIKKAIHNRKTRAESRRLFPSVRVAVPKTLDQVHLQIRNLLTHDEL